MLNSNEVGKMLGVSSYTVKRWAEEGKFKYNIKNNEMYFQEEEIERFMDETNIRYIKPENPKVESEKILEKHCKDNGLMTVDKISELIDSLSRS